MAAAAASPPDDDDMVMAASLSPDDDADAGDALTSPPAPSEFTVHVPWDSLARVKGPLLVGLAGPYRHEFSFKGRYRNGAPRFESGPHWLWKHPEYGTWVSNGGNGDESVEFASEQDASTLSIPPTGTWLSASGDGKEVGWRFERTEEFEQLLNELLEEETRAGNIPPFDTWHLAWENGPEDADDESTGADGDIDAAAAPPREPEPVVKNEKNISIEDVERRVLAIVDARGDDNPVKLAQLPVLYKKRYPDSVGLRPMNFGKWNLQAMIVDCMPKLAVSNSRVHRTTPLKDKLTALLKRPGNMMLLDELIAAFESTYGESIDFEKYGYKTLADFINDIPGLAARNEPGEGSYLGPGDAFDDVPEDDFDDDAAGADAAPVAGADAAPASSPTSDVDQKVRILVDESALNGRRLLLNSVVPLFKKKFGSPLDYKSKFSNLKDFIEQSCPSVVIVGPPTKEYLIAAPRVSDADAMRQLSDEDEGPLYPRPAIGLERKLVGVLEHAGGSILMSNFVDAFAAEHGFLAYKQIGYPKLKDLLYATPGISVFNDGGRDVVQLGGGGAANNTVDDEDLDGKLAQLVWEAPGNCVEWDLLPTVFLAKFGQPLDVNRITPFSTPSVAKLFHVPAHVMVSVVPERPRSTMAPTAPTLLHADDAYIKPLTEVTRVAPFDKKLKLHQKDGTKFVQVVVPPATVQEQGGDKASFTTSFPWELNNVDYMRRILAQITLTLRPIYGEAVASGLPAYKTNWKNRETGQSEELVKTKDDIDANGILNHIQKNRAFYMKRLGLDYTSFNGDFIGKMTWLHKQRHALAHDMLKNMGGEFRIGHKEVKTAFEFAAQLAQGTGLQWAVDNVDRLLRQFQYHNIIKNTRDSKQNGKRVRRRWAYVIEIEPFDEDACDEDEGAGAIAGGKGAPSADAAAQ